MNNLQSSLQDSKCPQCGQFAAKEQSFCLKCGADITQVTSTNFQSDNSVASTFSTIFTSSKQKDNWLGLLLIASGISVLLVGIIQILSGDLITLIIGIWNSLMGLLDISKSRHSFRGAHDQYQKAKEGRKASIIWCLIQIIWLPMSLIPILGMWIFFDTMILLYSTPKIKTLELQGENNESVSGKTKKKNMHSSLKLVLPEDIPGRKPELSGICPPLAILLIFLASLPVSIVLGIIAYYLGNIIGSVSEYVTLLLPKLLVISSSPYFIVPLMIIAFLLAVIVFVGYPVFMGALGGLVVAKFGKIGHCRSFKLAAWAGALNGIFIYLGHSIVAVVSSGGFQPMNDKTLEAIFNITISNSPYTIGLIILELAVVISASSANAGGLIQSSSYCETHKVWYSNWKRGSFSINSAETLVLAIQTQNALEAKTVANMQVGEDSYPRLTIETRECPSSLSCDVEITGKIFWELTEVSVTGKTSTEQKSEVWFNIMTPATFGHALNETLKLR